MKDSVRLFIYKTCQERKDSKHFPYVCRYTALRTTFVNETCSEQELKDAINKLAGHGEIKHGQTINGIVFTAPHIS